MFPLNSNQAYIKDTGERSTLGKVIGSGGGGGTSDYSELSNKPSINGVTLSGNKTTENLGISYNDLTNKPVIPNLSYSETEQDTGLTWIDGKHVYQRTVELSNPTVTSDGQTATTELDINSWNIENVISYSISCNSAISKVGTGFFAGNTGSQFKVYVFASGTDLKLILSSQASVFNSGTSYVTIQYTKATT